MRYTKAMADKVIELYSNCHSIQSICDAVGIDRTTFYVWKRRPEFLKALEDADAMRLDIIKDTARSGLLTLLQGKEYDEVTTEYEGVRQPDGSTKPVIKTRRVTRKFIMPNPTGVIFALKNVDRDTFQDLVKQEVEQNTTLNAVVDQTTTLIRKVTFKTRETTTKPQVLPNPQNN